MIENDKLKEELDESLNSIYSENIYSKIKDLNLELLFYIQKNEKLIEDLEEIQKEYLILKRKYKALRESKAGKLTLKYWKLKNRIK